jgi:hypothetical protein
VGRSMSSWSGWGGGWFLGGGTADHFADAWLCPVCATSEDKAGYIFCGCLAAFVLGVFALGIAFVLWASGGAR